MPKYRVEFEEICEYKVEFETAEPLRGSWNTLRHGDQWFTAMNAADPDWMDGLQGVTHRELTSLERLR